MIDANHTSHTLSDALKQGTRARMLTAEKIGEQRPWVAEIVGRYGSMLEREFVQGTPDYRQANSKRTRGVRYCFQLDHGKTYEICYRTSWGHKERYFARIEDGREVALDAGDVLATARDLTPAADPRLPALEGSEKQVAWAERIRREFLEELAGVVERRSTSPRRGHILSFAEESRIKEAVDAGLPPPELPPLQADYPIETLQRAYEYIASETSAAAWIDRRFHDPDLVMLKVIRQQRTA